MSTPFESFGKYVLLEKLATGGMAEVFLARGTGAGGIGKFFAIKRILPQYADSPEFIDMFKDEAKIAINLNHSNIVSIHEFGVEKGQFFLVMDYVEGRNLRQILNKMKKTGLQFSIDQIVYMIKEVAAGLDHAHRCLDGSTGKPLNITHRDMSPQNVMVSFEGEVKIVDFGIAKAESQLETTRAGTLKGKFGYMSPEQAEGQPVDLRTDIFSLGIVLWELLANDRLFVANNEINTLRKIRDCQIPSLRKINPNIHTELERIVQKGLARDRNLRYQTGAALHRDLNRFLNRQFPDFSPQDFAVFIKSVFADEILSLRKRLVDYTKVNVAAEAVTPKSQDTDEATSLLDTNTNSLVVTQTGTGSDGVPKELITQDLSVVNSHIQPNTMFNPDSAVDISAVSMPGTETDSLPPTQKPRSVTVPNASPVSLLDEGALNAAAEANMAPGKEKIQPLEVRESGNAIETEEISTPAYRAPDRRVPSRSGNQGTEYGRGPVESSGSARIATFLVFSLLCFSLYAYMVKYFTGTMADVIRATDPVLHDVHVALGVTLPERATASAPPPITQTAPLPEPTMPSIDGGTANAPDADQSGLVVTSNPSGADIVLNNQPTNLVTPARIQVPPQQTFTIAVRKRGYYEFKRTEVTRESVGHRLDASLQKMNIGYVDVEIFPPQDATLYINGKKTELYRNMANGVMIPAGVPVKIRADSNTAATFEEQTVTVAVDRRRVVKLNPRKMSRTPANR